MKHVCILNIFVETLLATDEMKKYTDVCVITVYAYSKNEFLSQSFCLLQAPELSFGQGLPLSLATYKLQIQ